MSDVIELVYGVGITPANIVDLKPGYVAVEGVRPPAEVDGMKTPTADLERATRNCALHRVVFTPWASPSGEVEWHPSMPRHLHVGDLVRVRHEQLEQLDVSEQGLCAINAQHILAVLK